MPQEGYAENGRRVSTHLFKILARSVYCTCAARPDRMHYTAASDKREIARIGGLYQAGELVECDSSASKA